MKKEFVKVTPYPPIFCRVLTKVYSYYGKYRTIKSNKDTPKISYLMFADDCIIFYRANKTATRNIKQVLHHYFMVSSQFVNYQES